MQIKEVLDSLSRLSKVDEVKEIGDMKLDFSMKPYQDLPTVSVDDMNVTEYGVRQLFGKLGVNKHMISELAYRNTELVENTTRGITNRYPANMFNDMSQVYLKYCIEREADREVLVREVGGVKRAFLSPKYTKIDNDDVMRSVAVALPKFGEHEIQMHEDEKMFVARIRFASTTTKVADGDEVMAGVDITNSEVGYSSLKVVPVIYRLVCSNGLRAWSNIPGNNNFRQIHLGGGWTEDNTVALADPLDKAMDLIIMIRALAKLPVCTSPKTSRITYEVASRQKVSLRVALEAEEELVRQNKAGYSAWDVINAFTLVSKKRTISERIMIEEAMGDMVNFKKWSFVD